MYNWSTFSLVAISMPGGPQKPCKTRPKHPDKPAITT